MRTATASDRAALLALMHAFYAEESIPWTRECEAALRELLAEPRLGAILLDDDDGVGPVVGYIAITLGFSLELGGRDAFVDELFVAPSHRRQGRGTRLLAAAQAWAQAAGARAIHLEVADPSDAKLRLYRAAGFAPRPHPLMIRRLDGP